MFVAINISSELAGTLLRDLRKEEEALARSDGAVGYAMAMYRIAVARYVAVRDAIQEQLGRNPYDTDVVTHFWPNVDGTDEPAWEHPDFGRYQYIGKKVGDAAVDALISWGRPLNLEELTGAIRNGGLKVDPRSVNASLMNLHGVTKQKDGYYIYEKPPDGDDLPF